MFEELASSARRCSRSLDFIVQALVVISQLLAHRLHRHALGVIALLVTMPLSSWCSGSPCMLAPRHLQLMARGHGAAALG